MASLVGEVSRSAVGHAASHAAGSGERLAAGQAGTPTSRRLRRTATGHPHEEPIPTTYPVADDEQDAVIIGTAATAGEAVKVAQRYYDEGGVSGIFGIRVVSANLRNATLSRDAGVAAPDQPGETIKAWVVSVG